MLKNDKVLIVSFFYPPSTAIGGRRWAYLGRELNERGFDVYVVTSDMNSGNGDCPWDDTVKKIENNIKVYPDNRPFYLHTSNPSTIFGKILYRLTLFRDKIFRSASAFDLSINFADDVYDEVENLINVNHIKNVIVTGGPFYMVYKLSHLKRKLGDKLNLLIDLRDPWTEHLKIENKVQKEKRQRQDIAMELADVVFMPDVKLVSNLANVYPNAKDKIKLLPHGYDEKIFKTKMAKGSFYKWYYAGTLYPGLDDEFYLIDKLIEKLNVKVDFYTFRTNVSYSVLNNSNVSVNGLLTQKELYETTYNSGITLFITRFKDYKSTKFYEIVRSGTFMLYIGKIGRAHV